MKTHKILLILFAAFSGWCGTMNAQDADLKKRMKDADPKVIGTRIVNKFLVTPHTRFGNPRAEKAPNYVTYPDACTWLGALWFSKAVKNKDMQQRLKERFAPLFTTEKNMLPRMVHVDYNVVGAVPLEIYMQKLGDRKYFDLGMKYADTQWEVPADAKPEEKAYAEQGYSWQTRVWIDDMFMITTIQSQAYLATGDRKYIDRAAAEMAMYLEKIQRPNGLFYHAPTAPFFWARGNGWMAAGMTELLGMLPEDNPNRERILESYRRMMNSLRDYRKEDGLWGQLVDDKTTWTETSGSAMFVYAMVKGVKKGWLDEATYAPLVRKAWIALIGHIDENGDIDGVCEGTNKTNDRQFYLNRKTLPGNMHGQAPVLWCVNAFLEK